jgi:hypothetical protein
MNDYQSKFKFNTKEMDFETRDRHIMLITLKIFVIAKAKNKPIVKSRWEQFFLAINPLLGYKSEKYSNVGVPSFGMAIDWLYDQGFIDIVEAPKKRYKLMSLKDNVQNKVISALEKNIEAYDDELEVEILNFMDNFDRAPSEGKRFSSKEEAYSSIFETDDIPF